MSDRTHPGWIQYSLAFTTGAASLCLSLFLSPLQILMVGIGGALIPFLVASSAGVVAVVALTSQFETSPFISDELLYILKWVLTFGFLAITAIRCVVVSELWDWSFPLVRGLFVALVAWGLLCAPFAHYPAETAIESVRLLVLLLLFIVTRETVRNQSTLWLVTLTFLTALMGASLFSISQFWSEGFFRLRGFFGNPNSYGVFVGFALPSAVLWAFLLRSRALQLTAIAVALPASLTLGLSWSRAAILNVIVQLVIFLLLERQWKWMRRLALTIVILVIVVLASPTLSNLIVDATRVTGGATHRSLLWSAAWDSVLQNPLFGKGHNLQQHEVVGRISQPDPGALIVFRDFRTKTFLPHNQLLVHAVSTGIPGLLLALALYAMLIRHFHRARESAGSSSERILQSGAIALICGALTNGVFEGGIIFGKGAINNYFWIALGVAAAVSRHRIFPPRDQNSESSR